MAQPRIEPLSPPYDQDVATHLAQTMPAGLDPIGLFRTLAVNLSMATGMWHFARHELGRSLTISLRQREILIDRTCARCGCEYEWGVHVAYFAERAKLSAEQVASLSAGDTADSCWTDEAERLLILAADQLHDSSDVTDELWSALSQHYDQAQLLDILMLCGWYHAISFVARAARVEPEAWAPRFGLGNGPTAPE
jgi:alkylhydroperoxidase family enzyme